MSIVSQGFSSKGGYGFMSMPGSGQGRLRRLRPLSPPGDIFFAKRDIPMAMQEGDSDLLGRCWTCHLEFRWLALPSQTAIQSKPQQGHCLSAT